MEEKMKYKFRIPFYSGTKKIIYIDENDFKKKYKGLRRICPTTFKYLCFEVFSKSLFDNEIGKHVLQLPTDKLFSQVHGTIQLVYSISNNAIIIEDLMPNEVLLDNYISDIKTYKGVPCITARDKFKIDLLTIMKGN